MDLDKLYQDLTNKEFTDVKLILLDKCQSIIIDVHKVILAFSSNYFHRIFNFGMEKNLKEITINVPDSKITYDMIVSFYGKIINSTNYSHEEYLLKMFKCRNYFCLSNDVSVLYDIKVPTEGFELLLEVAEELKCLDDKNLLTTIKNNIPDDYPLEKFSKDFLKEILLIKKYCVVLGCVDGVHVLDLKMGNLSKRFDMETEIAFGVSISPNGKLIASAHRSQLCLRDAATGDVIHILFEQKNINFESMEFSTDNLQIVAYCYQNIYVWDVLTGQLLYNFMAHDTYISTVSFSSDNTKIVSTAYNDKIKIWDTTTLKSLKTIDNHTKNYYQIKFSLDNSKIIGRSSDNIINIWNIDTGNLLNSLQVSDGIHDSIYDIAISSDNTKIVSVSYHKIRVWHLETGKLLNTFNITAYNTDVAFIEDDHKIMTLCGDTIIRIWDIQTGILLKTLTSAKKIDQYIKYRTLSLPISYDIDTKIINYLNSEAMHIDKKYI